MEVTVILTEIGPVRKVGEFLKRRLEELEYPDQIESF